MILELMAVGAAVMFFWNYIVHFCSQFVIPWIKKYCGVTAGELFARLITFLDGGIPPTKNLLKKMWKHFKEHVLKIDSNYEKVDANTANRQTTTIIKDSNGEPTRTIVEEKISWSDLPPEIREQMIYEGTNEGSVDDKQQIENQMEKRCEEECIEIMI